MKNPYEVLGVANNTPVDECKKAYRRLSRTYHPDNGGDSNKFDEVQKAWKLIESGNVQLPIDFVIKRNHLRHKTLFSFV